MRLRLRLILKVACAAALLLLLAGIIAPFFKAEMYGRLLQASLERAARFHAWFIEQVDRAPEALIAAGKGSPYTSALGQCQGSSVVSRSSPQ